LSFELKVRKKREGDGGSERARFAGKKKDKRKKTKESV
jgi:hypothetical protein